MAKSRATNSPSRPFPAATRLTPFRSRMAAAAAAASTPTRRCRFTKTTAPSRPLRKVRNCANVARRSALPARLGSGAGAFAYQPPGHRRQAYLGEAGMLAGKLPALESVRLAGGSACPTYLRHNLQGCPDVAPASSSRAVGRELPAG